MENKILKAAVFAMMLGVAGSAMAGNYAYPTTGSGNKYDPNYSEQTVVGTQNTVSGTSASAYGNLNYAIGNYSTAIGFRARTDDATGDTAGTGGSHATAVGNYVTASGNNSVALGAGTSSTKITKATGAQSIAIGYLTSATSDNATAFGNGASAGAKDSIVIGTNAETVSGADGGIAIGQESSVSAANAMAFGISSYAASDSAMALGNGSRVAEEADNGIAIGTNAYVKVGNAVAIGTESAVSAAANNPTDRVVSFGHTADDTYIENGNAKRYSSAQTSRLINVTAGYQDTDAVNFSQIKTTARTDDDLKNGTYIQSSLTDATTVNKNGTVGKNIEALDAKMAVSDQTVTLATTARDDAKSYKGRNNQIVSNDGTVLATFKSSKPGAEATEAEKLAATDFVTNGDVYAAIAARAQKISLDTETTRTINNKNIKSNQIASNDGTVLAEFESEKPSSLTGKKFVTSGDVYAADVKSGQEVTLDAATTRESVNDVEIKKNQIATNDGTVLATFKSSKPGAGATETEKLAATDFVTNGAVYSDDAQKGQTVTLSTAKRDTVNGVEIKGNEIATNEGVVLATFTSEKPSTLTGTAFVTSGDVFAADTKEAQEVTLATTERETVNNVSIQKNQIATNEGVVLATFTSEKPSTLTGTAFVTSGNVFAADVKEGQSVSLSTDKRETVNGTDIQKKQIATNEGKVLATFEDATYAKDDKGFVSGGLLWSQSIAAGQTPSFAAGNNVIKNNNKDVLVTFEEGVVAVASGAKGAKNEDTNFVSARNAYDNDVAYAQTFTLDGNTLSGDFVTNAGATVGTVNITRGSVGENNMGFVTGHDVWLAIAKYNQTIDFSKVDTSTNSSTTNDTGSNGDGADDATGGDTGSGQGDGSETGGTTGGEGFGGGASDESGGTTGGDSGDESDTTGGDTGTGGAGDSGSGEQSGSDSGEDSGNTDGGNTDGGNTDESGGTGDAGDADSGDSGSTTLNNKIYANDGTVIATLRQGEVADNDTGFVSGGQVFEADIQADQTIDSTNREIKNNNGDTLVTFTEGEVAAGNTGFVSGDQVNTVKTDLNNADVAPGQTIESGKLVITNNKGETLVTFTEGKVEAGNKGFVSGDQVNTVKTELSNADVAKGQTIDSTNNLIKNNNGETLVTFTKGEVAAGNTGFVSGDQVNTVKTEIGKDIETVKTEVKENFEKVNTEIADVNTRVDETQQNLATLGGQVNEVEDRVSKVGAGAAALAALHPLDYDPNAKLTFAVGYGNYRSKSAAAIGAFVRPNNRFMWSLAATMGNGENMYNTGLSFAIGSGKGIRMSRAELDFKVGQLSDSLTQMTAEHQTFARDNAQQDAAILDLHARLKRVEEILSQLTAQ